MQRRPSLARFSGHVYSLVVSQAVVAIIGLARVPLAIDSGGEGLYAFFASAHALLLWQLFLPNTIRSLHRSHREHIGNIKWDARAILITVSVALVGCSAFVAGTVGWVAAVPGASQGLVGLACLIVVICAGFATLGGRRVAYIDLAVGTHVFPVLSSVSAVIGLPLYYIAVVANTPVEVQVLIWLLPAVLPYYFAGIRLLPRRWRALPSLAQTDGSAPVAPYLLLTLASIAGGGLSVFVVGFFLSDAEVASFALATRLAIPVFVISGVLSPFVSREIAVASPEDRATDKSMARILMISLAVAAALGTVYFLVGPSVGTWLTGGEVAVPLVLYAVIALQSISSTLINWLWGWASRPDRAHGLAAFSLVFGTVNLALGVLLTATMGVVGPRLASLILNLAQSAAIILRSRVLTDRRIGAGS